MRMREPAYYERRLDNCHRAAERLKMQPVGYGPYGQQQRASELEALRVEYVRLHGLWMASKAQGSLFDTVTPHESGSALTGLEDGS